MQISAYLSAVLFLFNTFLIAKLMRIELATLKKTLLCNYLNCN